MSVYAESPQSRPGWRSAKIVSWPSIDQFYPPDAIKQERHGVAVVRACVNQESAITSVQISKSSGHPDLDEAALALGRLGTYSASQSLDDGTYAASCVSFRVKFDIKLSYAKECDGILRDGKRETDGSVTFSDGRIFFGKFKNNQLNGEGKMSVPDGKACEGRWMDGVFVEGTVKFSDGSKLTGPWRDGVLNGQGSFTSSAFSYVGEYRDGKANGLGTNVWSNGDKYVGEYRDDRIHGHGTFTWADGGKYVGDFSDDSPNGQGAFLHPNGTLYVGEWKSGKYNGQGSLTLPSGEKYIGQFLTGARHGWGKSTLPDGSKFEAEWMNDSLVTKKESENSNVLTKEINPNASQSTVDVVRECVRKGFKPGSERFTRCITNR